MDYGLKLLNAGLVCTFVCSFKPSTSNDAWLFQFHIYCFLMIVICHRCLSPDEHYKSCDHHFIKTNRQRKFITIFAKLSIFSHYLHCEVNKLEKILFTPIGARGVTMSIYFSLEHKIVQYHIHQNQINKLTSKSQFILH